MAIAVFLTACGGTTEDPSPSPTEPLTSAPSPSPSEASWRDDYTADQLANYDAALKRYEEFWSKDNDAKAKGADTPGVKAMYEDYSFTAAADYNLFVKSYVKGGVRLEVPPTALWFEAGEIRDEWLTVVQCTDYSKMRLVKNGQTIPQGDLPPVRTIVVKMSKPKGHDWMRTPTDSGGKKCAPRE